MLLMLSNSVYAGALGSTVVNVFAASDAIRITLSDKTGNNSTCAPNGSINVAFTYTNESPELHKAFLSIALSALATKKSVYIEYDSIDCEMGHPIHALMIKE